MAARTPLAFRRHNHETCKRAALRWAERECADRGLNLTESRRRVFEILLEQHKALGAYEILDRLGTAGKRPQPPIAYRALDFLVEHGFVHRIEKRNAYIACADPGGDHAPAFMLCKGCDAVAELPGDLLADGLAAAAAHAGFAPERSVIEIEGVCTACRQASTRADSRTE